MPREGDRPAALRGLGPYLSLVYTFGLTIGGLALLGSYLDRRWGTGPWMTLAGGGLGMVVGFTNLIRTALPPKKGGP